LLVPSKERAQSAISPVELSTPGVVLVDSEVDDESAAPVVAEVLGPLAVVVVVASVDVAVLADDVADGSSTHMSERHCRPGSQPPPPVHLQPMAPTWQLPVSSVSVVAAGTAAPHAVVAAGVARQATRSTDGPVRKIEVISRAL
jgi:hypothetical protein